MKERRMPRRRLRLIAVCARPPPRSPAAAQTEEKKPAFGITFSGFVKTDIFYDTRQTVSIREGHFLLYPKGPLARPRRRRTSTTAADVQHPLHPDPPGRQDHGPGRPRGQDLGLPRRPSSSAPRTPTSTASASATATSSSTGRSSELMIGQFWHPMFVTESFPDVVSFDTGAPFQPFNRSPQVRYTRMFGKVSLTATALAQRDFASNGPDGDDLGLPPQRRPARVQPQAPVRLQERRPQDRDRGRRRRATS
ncbi:MAG: hypothetical protein MZW92_10215 [Comamonadaceae bacterium]|nr:hypothetical protein [Comamonadaceae bacterium]